MLGCYDFCGHYEWTFAWLQRAGGPGLLREYWREAIHRDSQQHARELILRDGLAGMVKYWSATLGEESPDGGYHVSREPAAMRLDVHDCPSKGFLLRNELQQFEDYCDHCMGWVGPLLRDAGFVVDHEHNHCGQCWWRMRPRDAEPAADAPAHDVRRRADWSGPKSAIDRFVGATAVTDKQPTITRSSTKRMDHPDP